jgi:Arc/MetJ-type ribon-helix-helix transcriptional regulator
MADLNIELPPPQARFLEEQVASGRSASDVVTEALRRYEAAMASDGEDIAFHVARGDADYAAGRFNTYANKDERRASMDRLVAKARERWEARAASH